MNNSQTSTDAQKPWANPEHVEHGRSVFLEYFMDDDAGHERKGLIADLISTNGDDKDFAFCLLTGFAKTGKIDRDHIVQIIVRNSSSPTAERVPVFITAYLEKEPSDADAIVLMEQIKSSYPEMLAKVIIAKKSWPKKEIRAYIRKYAITKDLWRQLDKHIKEKGAEAVTSMEERSNTQQM